MTTSLHDLATVILELQHHILGLEAKLADSEAGAAALRTAIEDWDLGGHPTTCDLWPNPPKGPTCTCGWDRVESALASDAGTELLARLADAERDRPRLRTLLGDIQNKGAYQLGHARALEEAAQVADGNVTRAEPANALNAWQHGYSRGRQEAAAAIRALQRPAPPNEPNHKAHDGDGPQQSGGSPSVMVVAEVRTGSDAEHEKQDGQNQN